MFGPTLASCLGARDSTSTGPPVNYSTENWENPVAQDIVYVHLHDDRVWQVTHLSRVLGQFDVQSEAIRVAVDSANQLGIRNCDGARVIVIDETDNLDPIWIYGRDQYPPERLFAR
jgi:hypothetical protein